MGSSVESEFRLNSLNHIAHARIMDSGNTSLKAALREVLLAGIFGFGYSISVKQKYFAGV
jgi:hypothetical protein